VLRRRRLRPPPPFITTPRNPIFERHPARSGHQAVVTWPPWMLTVATGVAAPSHTVLAAASGVKDLPTSGRVTAEQPEDVRLGCGRDGGVQPRQVGLDRPSEVGEPGDDPVGMPVSRMATMSARGVPAAFSAARFGKTPGYSAGNSAETSGRSTSSVPRQPGPRFPGNSNHAAAQVHLVSSRTVRAYRALGGDHLARPGPVRYGITRSGQVQVASQGWPSRSRGVFSDDSHDRSRT